MKSILLDQCLAAVQLAVEAAANLRSSSGLRKVAAEAIVTAVASGVTAVQWKDEDESK